MDDEGVSFPSASGDDVQPRVQTQFSKLASTLRDTNENLHTFEGMLDRYREMAKNASSPRGNDAVTEQLRVLAEAVDRLRGERNSPPDDGLRTHLRAELLEEKRKRTELERKLENERRSARSLAQDVARYVETVKALEGRIRSREEEKKSETESTLCQSCLDRTFGSEVAAAAAEVRESASVLRSRWEEERRLRTDLSRRHSACRERLNDREAQIRRTKSDLVSVRMELAEARAERETLAGSETAAREEASNAKLRLASSRESLERLKAKSGVLLAKYRGKKRSTATVDRKVRRIHGWLIDLRTACELKEANHRKILDHLGVQIEITARLLSTYLKLAPPPPPPPSKSDGRSLSAWFRDVQALASWTHSQMADLGTGTWTETSVVAVSDPSHTLDDAESLVRSHDNAAECQKDCFRSILSVVGANGLSRQVDGSEE